MELQSIDLGIGNYLSWIDGELAEIRYILEKAIGLTDDIESYLAKPLSFFDPINITDQWLIDLKICQPLKVHNDFFTGTLKIVKTPQGYSLYLNDVHLRYIEFVHTLQNLVYDLSGIKLTK